MPKTSLITSLAGQTGQTKAEVTATLDALMDTVPATLLRFTPGKILSDRLVEASKGKA